MPRPEFEARAEEGAGSQSEDTWGGRRGRKQGRSALRAGAPLSLPHVKVHPPAEDTWTGQDGAANLALRIILIASWQTPPEHGNTALGAGKERGHQARGSWTAKHGKQRWGGSAYPDHGGSVPAAC